MSYEMKLEQGLSQQLNQFQGQSLKILSFDNYELEKFLQDEYAENPLMEHKESGKEFFTLHGNAGGYQDIEQSDIENRRSRSLLYGTVKCKRLYKERVECYEIHGTMPRGIRAFACFHKRDQSQAWN